MNDNGNGKTWGVIKEVDRTLLDVRFSMYTSLFAELSLRLEQTSPTKCLAVPFCDIKIAETARSGLRKLFSKSNPREITMVVREMDDAVLLLVGWSSRRGKGLKGVVRTRRKVSEDCEE